MERRAQERDIGVGGVGVGGGGEINPMNSYNHNHNHQQQETQVKLPLAPIVSTPPDRRGPNATVSTRRGSSIFSPTTTSTQTLDHHPNQQHLHQHLTPQKEPNPDPDPTHNPTCSNSKNPPSPPSPPPPPPPPVVVRYRECLKNHAASMGGHVVDGCGEFMPGGEDGTLLALRCAACDCHRNFHRREAEGEHSHYYTTTYNNNNNNNNHSRNPQNNQTLPSIPHQHKPSHSFSQGFTTQPTMVNFSGGGGGGGGVAAESSSEDLNMFQTTSCGGGGGGGHAMMESGGSGSRKRFRTKFSREQKERMHEFASKLGWRMQKQDEEEVVQFCNEVGVKRQVFKVWMHNNKQAMKRRQQTD